MTEQTTLSISKLRNREPIRTTFNFKFALCELKATELEMALAVKINNGLKTSLNLCMKSMQWRTAFIRTGTSALPKL